MKTETEKKEIQNKQYYKKNKNDDYRSKHK